MSDQKSLAKELVEAGVIFGQRRSNWNPKMKPYLFGVRNGVHIIDLTKTVPLLEQALLQALATPETRTVLGNIGVQPSSIGSAAFAAMTAEESRQWSEVVRERRITKE